MIIIHRSIIVIHSDDGVSSLGLAATTSIHTQRVILTGIVLLGRFAARWRGIPKAEYPFVLDAQHTARDPGIVLVVLAAEQVVGRKVFDNLFHNLGGHLQKVTNHNNNNSTLHVIAISYQLASQPASHCNVIILYILLLFALTTVAAD